MASTSATPGSSFSRSRLVAPLPYRPPLSSLLDETGLDDGIVPSTPTLFAPRRLDGFGEAVSSPHVPSSVGGRFTFNEAPHASGSVAAGESQSGRSNEAVPEHRLLEVPQGDDNSTGRSVPTTPLQSSPQESIPVVAEDQSDRQTTQSEAETPQAIVSGADEIREGSSEEVADQAGTSSEEARERGDLEGDDGVSSEGEKQPSTEEGEEEGREAEASQSTNPSRARNVRGNGARRSMRIGTSQRGSRQGPTPIIWGDQRNSPLRQHHDRGRSPQGYGTRTVARRARGRIQRPYGGRF